VVVSQPMAHVQLSKPRLAPSPTGKDRDIFIDFYTEEGIKKS
jgi:hypothetical protein